jgi:Uma2 family endonuclease
VSVSFERPDHLLTLAEWDELTEELCRRGELVEGVLVVVPGATALHQRAMSKLCTELNRQLPAHYSAVPDVDVVLETAPLPTVRKPDVVVAPNELIETNPARITGADAVLAIEIISPGSGRTDQILKLAEYAAAGIANYWIVELGPPVSITIFRLHGEAYQLVTEGAGLLSLEVPAPIELDLDALIRR